jgi:hypothetical protein
VALVVASLVLGVGLRLFLAVAFEGNFDQVSFEIVADIVRRGGNVYAETSRYNYTPVWSILLGGFDLLAQYTGQPLHVVVRSALTLVDVVNAILIGRIGLVYAGTSVSRGFATYLLNPVAILVVGYHGQFETLAALPLLLAVALGPAHGRVGVVGRWLLGTTSLVIKHILIFQVWVLFWYTFRPRMLPRALFVAGTVFFASLIPYINGGVSGIAQNVFRYSGLPGLYGFGAIRPRAVAVLGFALASGVAPRSRNRASSGEPQIRQRSRRR